MIRLPESRSGDVATVTGPSETSLKAIVAYKLIKAAVEIAAGALLFFATAGVIDELKALEESLRAHAAASWSLVLAEQLVRAATGRNIAVVALASFLDGALSFVEGWVLHRRLWWSRWLIVGATSSLLPFEIVALVRRLTAGRIGLLLVNALIVIVLLKRRVGAARLETAAPSASLRSPPGQGPDAGGSGGAR